MTELPQRDAPRGVDGPRRRSMTLVVAAGVVALGAAAAGVVHSLSGTKPPHMAEHLPRDTAWIIEVPEVAAATSALLAMDIIDDEALKSESLAEEMTADLEQSFGIDSPAAKAFVDDLGAVAVAGRWSDGAMQTAGLLQMNGTEAMARLLASARFHQIGPVGTSGVRYRLDPDPAAQEEPDDWDAYRRTMGAAEATEDDSALVWFENERLLVSGDLALLTDVAAVVDGSAKSLADTPRWDSADFDDDAHVVAYLDPEVALPPESRLEVFDGVAPPTMSVAFASPGLVTTLDIELSTGVVPVKNVPRAKELDIFERLPKQTVAYVAVSTLGEEARAAIAGELLESSPEYDDLARYGTAFAERELGVSAADLSSAIGGQAVFALATDRDHFDVDLSELDPVAMALKNGEKFAAAMLVEVGDDDAAQKLIGMVRSEAEKDLPNVVERDGGALMMRDGADEALYVGIIKNNAVVVFGGSAVVEHFIDAAGGGDALVGDRAHQAAIALFEDDARLVAWLDAGWLGNEIRKYADENDPETLAEIDDETHVPLDALVGEGDDRLSMALALYVEADAKRWKVRAQGLNGPVIGAVGVGVAVWTFAVALGEAVSELDVDTPP